MFRLTPVVKQLLIINVLVFLGSMVFNTNNLALYYWASPKFHPYQIVTHFFMHANIAHIFFNMFALVMFGSALEALWGARKFLFFYIFCAMGAALLHTGYNYFHFSELQTVLSSFTAAPGADTYAAFFDNANMNMLTPESKEWISQIREALQSSTSGEVVDQAVKSMEQYIQLEMNVPVVGASGAIYGLLLAFGMLFPNAELMLIFLPIPIKAKYFIPLLMLVELYLGVNRFSWDNIAHFAHLGGALFGFLLILYWRKFDNTYRRD